MTSDHEQSVSTDDATETRKSHLNRRAYLRALGGMSVLSALGGLGSQPATAETADPSKTVDERIQEHRTGTVEIVVENPDGSPVPDADVAISQQTHAFNFGTAVNANTLINNSSPGDNYRTYIPELFNTTVLENRHKWRFWENEQQLADQATQWLLDQGLNVRGHVCIWGRDGVSAIPDDIQTAIDNQDAQTIRDRSMQHIEDIITHYGDDITEWEIVNEAMHTYQLQLGVYGDQIDTDEPWTGEVVPWTSQLLADWYSQAASVIAANGLDVGIGVNDFNQFPYAYTDGRYETEIDHINSAATQLDTVGLQAHVAARTGEFNSNDNPDGRISASQVTSEINKWADHGARVKITEFDTYNGDDWTSDQERADMLENYLRGAFSHPGVDAFIMWGFWDGRHWENEAPLFSQDWSQKPAYDVWTGLVFDEWWTDETATTDSQGTHSTSAFLGTHEITAETDGDTTTTTTTVTDSAGTTTVTLTLDGSGGGDDDTTAPSTPTNLSVSSTTNSSVTVTWNTASDTGGSGLDHYVVTVDGSQNQTVAAGMTQTTVSSLSAGTSYEIGVRAVDGAGNESATTTVAATTTDDDGSGTVLAEVDPSTTTASVGEQITFQVTDTSGSGQWITALDWTFGDGTTATGWWNAHTYDAPGNYTVALTATDNEGNTTTHEITITVS
ncbi:endo-1,4-beta-xylanase [Halocatena salina]|uniref:endo-1,4-beta-xylanase n=1 Tax=Halocatena salina TaxID=2934340 RepID=A0A8U0A7V1_9EURY|nr:endo-1,4-beta-xylanase [Halocatena salina]UPM45182.1 endo-1,4-beta-xylanase [Halocatena salina]